MITNNLRGGQLQMQKHGFTYVRYIEDLVLMVKSKARLRKAIKVTQKALKPWGYQLHTNGKTFIGKITKGFDFCGFRLSYDKIILAKSFWQNLKNV